MNKLSAAVLAGAFPRATFGSMLQLLPNNNPTRSPTSSPWQLAGLSNGTRQGHSIEHDTSACVAKEAPTARTTAASHDYVRHRSRPRLPAGTFFPFYLDGASLEKRKASICFRIVFMFSAGFEGNLSLLDIFAFFRWT